MGENPIEKSTVTESRPGLLRRSLFGAHGLRAGWRVLIFLAIVVLVSALGSALVKHIVPSGHTNALSPIVLLLIESVLAVAIFVATCVMAKTEKRSVWSYGLSDRRMLTRFSGGMVVGVLLISAIVGLLWASRLLVFERELLIGAAIWAYGALWMVQTLVVALVEESLFRGYILVTLTRGLNFWWAIVITSIVFGAAHAGNPGETPLGLINTAMGGFMLGFSLRLTGSLWWAIGMHTALNWSELYLYGITDSGMLPAEGRLLASHPVGTSVLSGGGMAGPEGSIYFTFAVLAVVGGLWLFWGRDRMQRSAFPS